jgi:hypothetical protein
MQRTNEEQRPAQYGDTKRVATQKSNLPTKPARTHRYLQMKLRLNERYISGRGVASSRLAVHLAPYVLAGRPSCTQRALIQYRLPITVNDTKFKIRLFKRSLDRIVIGVGQYVASVIIVE